MMKSLEKKLRESIREGSPVSGEMHPFAKKMLKQLRDSQKRVAARPPAA
jgi:hypothetical protein